MNTALIDCASAPLVAKVIRNPSDWDALATRWDKLLTDSPESTPWQSWSYLHNWWRYLAGKRSLYVITVERGGQPCLVLPLQLTRTRMLGLPIRALEPIGMWTDVNRPRLALGTDDPECYDRAFDLLWSHRNEWDLLRIDEKLPDDSEVEHLRRFCGSRGLLFRQIFSHLCPYLNLGQSWQTFLQARGQKMRKNLRAAKRRLESIGRLGLTIHRSTAEIEAAFGIVLDLHRQSWKSRKRVEHSHSAAYQSFYKNWLMQMATEGRARILTLHCDGRAIAATIAFTQGDVYHSSQIVHSAEFAHCSPGTLLESMELEGLMDEKKFKHYDFLGSFLNNKLRWTDSAHATFAIFALQDGVKSQLIDSYYFSAKPRIKRAYAKLRAAVLRKNS